MMDVVVNLMIATELALISFLAHKTYRLYQQQELEKEEAETQVNDTVLSTAQEFAIDQLLSYPVEREVNEGKNPETINEAISLYLIGAMRFIGRQKQCDRESLYALTSRILKSQLDLTPIALGKYFSIAAKDLPETSYESLLAAGEKAAEAWLCSHSVPETECLRSRVDQHLMAA